MGLLQSLRNVPSNHSPLFDMYEPSMELGVRALSQLAVDYLQQSED